MHLLIWGDTPLAAWLVARLHPHYTLTWLTTTPADTLWLHGVAVRGINRVNELSAAKKPDFIILAAPVWYTAQAARALATFAPLPPILALQWGVGGIKQLESALGAGCALLGVVTRRIGFGADAGHIEADNFGGVALQGDHPQTAAAAQILTAAGLPVTRAAGVALQWSSVFWGIQGNALSAILDIAPEEIYQDPLLFAYEYQQLIEAQRVIAGLGVRLVALPGVDVPRRWHGLRWLPRRLAPFFLGRGVRPPSLRDDLLGTHKRSDAAYLNGAVAVAAYDLGLRAPVNHALALTVTDIAEGRALWAGYKEGRELLFATLRLSTGAH